MKLAIISDMHHFHWTRVYGSNDKRYPVTTITESLEKNKPDLMIDAGDYEKIFDWPVPTLYIPGNHDYYGKSWDYMISDPDQTHYVEYNGLKIAMCTLWGNLNENNEFSKNVYELCLNDRMCITGFDADKCVYINTLHRKFLLDHIGADIVVTHHCPSFRSVHERYKKGLAKSSPQFHVNYGFASRLDDLVKEMKAKIWIHGHTHDAFDYKIESTRVLCHPCGYPSERNGTPYEPLYIEV